MKLGKCFLLLLMAAAVVFTACELDNGEKTAKTDTIDLSPIYEFEAGDDNSVLFYELEPGVVCPSVFATSKEVLESLSAMTVEDVCKEYNNGIIPEKLASIATEKLGNTLSDSEEIAAAPTVIVYDSGVRTNKAYYQSHYETGTNKTRIVMHGTLFKSYSWVLFGLSAYRPGGPNFSILKRLIANDGLAKGVYWNFTFPPDWNRFVFRVYPNNRSYYYRYRNYTQVYNL